MAKSKLNLKIELWKKSLFHILNVILYKLVTFV